MATQEALRDDCSVLSNDDRAIMVDVDHVSMSFNMASEQLNSLKEYFIKLFKHELFFKEFVALDDVSFTVRKGDVVGIVGTNGSGKSTMLKIVAGVLEPTHGSCSINGSIAPLIELGAGFDLELTARENIYLNGALLGYSKSYISEHFDEIVDFAELRDFLDLPMKNYSSGMVARIAFAIATIIVPDILIVDEALSVGDVFFQEKCERRIKSLIHDHHTTVLFVSHSIDQVERICQSAVWIEKGHKVMEGDVHEVCSAYRSMGYVDYVTAHGIMERDYKGDPDIRHAAFAGEVASALWNCGVANPAGTHATTDDEGRILPLVLDAMLAGERDDIVAHFASCKADSVISREDAAYLLQRFARERRPRVSEPGASKLSAFADAEVISEHARDALAWCVERGIFEGTIGEGGVRLIEPTSPLSRIGLAKMFSVLFRSVLSYADDVSPTDPYALTGAYDYVHERGILQGYGSGLFGGMDATTRLQTVIVLWRCAGRPAVDATCPYPDIAGDNPHRDQVIWAVDEGILPASFDTYFIPDDPIAPSDFSALVESFCRSRGIDVPVEVYERSVRNPKAPEAVTRATLTSVAADLSRRLEGRSEAR